MSLSYLTAKLPPVNPHNTTHGDRTAEVRHVGDLGNLETDAQGNAKGSVQDNLIKVIGPESVIGVCLSCHGQHIPLPQPGGKTRTDSC